MSLRLQAPESREASPSPVSHSQDHMLHWGHLSPFFLLWALSRFWSHEHPNKGFSWESARIQEALCIHSFLLPGQSTKCINLGNFPAIQQLGTKCINLGNFPAIQQLGICTPTAKDPGLIPVQGTKIPQAAWCSQKEKKKHKPNDNQWYCFNWAHVWTMHWGKLHIRASKFYHDIFQVYYKHWKRTQQIPEREKGCQYSEAPSGTPFSYVPQGTPCVLWWVLNFIVLLLNCVWLFVTLWTIACQAPLSLGFFSQEYWSGLPFPPPGDLPDTGIEPTSPVSPALQTDSLLLSHQGSPLNFIETVNIFSSGALWDP